MADYTDVDPGMVQFLNGFYEQGGAPLSLDTLPEARAMMGAFPEMFDAPAVEVGEIRNLKVAGGAGDIPARLYVPENAPKNNVGLIFYHGGGWILGDLDSHDRLCRRLCKAGNLTVLSVDYRLAPEHKFPAALDDAQAAFLWACEHAGEIGVDPNRLAIGGDSAGGNISSSIALSLRGNPRGEPAFQLLIYPATDLYNQPPSYERCGDGYFLDIKDMDFFISCYLGDTEKPKNQRISPLVARDKSDLPSAYVVTAGFDPLSDDGIAYAKALEEAGVAVTHMHYPSMIHGFFSMTGLSPVALEALEESAKFVSQSLQTKEV